MPSLESAAATRLRLITASVTLIDQTNQRDSDAAENTAISDAAVEMACSEVKAVLGSSVDSTDTFALDAAVRLTKIRLANWWNDGFTEGGNQAYRQLRQSLEFEAEARRQGKKPSVVTPDTTFMQELDQLYPQSQWADGQRSYDLPSGDDDV